MVSKTLMRAYKKIFVFQLNKKIVEDLISACREHVVAATGLSPFKVGDNQRPERTTSGVENLRLSVPSPAKN